MGAKGDSWARKVEAHFDYLSQFGFTRLAVSDDSFWEVRVTYTSDTSAIAVIRSVEFDRVDVQLMRLVNGVLPEYPIFIVDSVAVNTFYLDDLVRLRTPDRPRASGGLSDAHVDRQLASWAASLREAGQDFLAGDLGVLDELEQLVRLRAASTPQQVTVWMHEATAASDADAAVDGLTRKLPEGVDVVQRRYRRRDERS